MQSFSSASLIFRSRASRITLCAGLGVTSSELYAQKQADLYEEQQARLYEEQQAALCDSGLPDTEVCDGLQLPPVEMPIFSEAWSRGYVQKCSSEQQLSRHSHEDVLQI